MGKSIYPDDHTVEFCLKNKLYHIDFYQREYIWTKETVEILLRDIFYAFELSYEQYKDSNLTPELLEKFNWYYLNIFITNNVDGKVYIVDGQQRLTTLTLIAAKLYHMTTNDENLRNSLKDCIFGWDRWKGNIYWLDNEKRKAVMDCIMNNSEFPVEFKNKTEETLVSRYKDISDYLEKKDMDIHKLKTFVYYFLERLVLVELKIEKDDTPMIFEVINDRGEALKPFEILKGKLVGTLSKDDTDMHSEMWDESMVRLFNKEDEFFSDYLKARFIYKRNSKVESSINNSYHRFIFEANDIADALGFRKTDNSHIQNIKNFISKELEYYSKLYAKIRKNDDEFLKYNNEILTLSGQYQLILAACNIDDTQEDEKIHTIAKEYDRMFILLTLNGVYNSNTWQEISYALNERIHGLPLSDYRKLFNGIIEDTIKERKGIQMIASLLEFSSFLKADYTNVEKRSLRYFLARVEKFICDGMNRQMQNDVQYISTKTSYKTGYHIEHILSRNQTNVEYFNDEEEFNSKRNQLGGLLLLKDRDNISIGNKEYVEKLKTYSAGLVWGHSLCEDFYHTNKDFEDFNAYLQRICGQKIESINVFDKDALNRRNKLLFNIVKQIWEID